MRDPFEPEPPWATGKALDRMEVDRIESSILPPHKKEAAAKVASDIHVASDLELEQVASELIPGISEEARMELDIRRPPEPPLVEADPVLDIPSTSSDESSKSDEDPADGHDEFEEGFVEGYVEGYEE